MLMLSTLETHFLLYSSFFPFQLALVGCPRFTASNVSSEIVLPLPLLIRRWTARDSAPRTLEGSEKLGMHCVLVAL